MKAKWKKFLKNLGHAVNALAIALTVHTANTTCDWLYFQAEEPDEVKRMRKF